MTTATASHSFRFFSTNFYSSIWMCAYFIFCLPSFGVIFFNSFDKFVNNQFLTMKYSKILLAFACFSLVKFVYANLMLAGIHHLSLSVLWLWHSRLVCTKNHIWKSLLNITKYRSKNNMHFSIHVLVHSLFAMVRYTLISSTKEEGNKLEMICDILFYLEFLFLTTILHVCEHKCDPAFEILI